MVASGITLLLGFLALIGWIFDLPVLTHSFKGFSTMKVNTAIAAILAGGSLGLQRLKKIRPAMRWLAWGCASLVLFVGVATLGEYMFGLDFGIDQLLVRDPLTAVGMFQGRMSPVTAICFVFTGWMLIFLERPAAFPWVQGLAVTQFSIAGIGFVHCLYGAEQFFGLVQNYSGMPIQTAFSFVVLSGGILSCRSNEGIVRFVTGPGSASILARRFLPIIIVIPVFIGWLGLAGERAGYYDAVFGVSIMVISMIILLTISILQGYKLLFAQESNFKLVVEAAPASMIMVDGEGKIALVNTQTETLFGYTREELVGQKVEMLVPEWFRENPSEKRKGFLRDPTKAHAMGAGAGAGDLLYGLKKMGQRFPSKLGSTPSERRTAYLLFPPS